MFYKCFTDMATIKAVVLKHQQKEDGTYNVKFRLTHNRSSVYISSPYFVSPKQLDKDFNLKPRNNFVYDEVMKILLFLRDQLSSLSYGIESLSAKQVADFLQRKLKKDEEPRRISLKQFAEKEIERIKSSHTRLTYKNRLSVILRYFGENVCFQEINYKSLLDFESYLFQKKGLTGTTVNHLMGFLSYMFRLARKEYNDEDLGVVLIYNPFVKYKRPKMSVPPKKAWEQNDFCKLLTLDTSRLTPKRQMAYDIVLISFLLCGINPVDIYSLEPPKKGYIHYFRKKTRDRKADRSELRIKVQPELEYYLQKYKDCSGKRAFNFYESYPNEDDFSACVSSLISNVRRILSLENYTVYMARHTWATVAYNDLGINESDIAFCLTHASHHQTTDFYIKKNFDKVDVINRKVIDWVFYGKRSDTI